MRLLRTRFFSHYRRRDIGRDIEFAFSLAALVGALLRCCPIASEEAIDSARHAFLCSSHRRSDFSKEVFKSSGSRYLPSVPKFSYCSKTKVNPAAQDGHLQQKCRSTGTQATDERPCTSGLGTSALRSGQCSKTKNTSLSPKCRPASVEAPKPVAAA